MIIWKILLEKREYYCRVFWSFPLLFARDGNCFGVLKFHLGNDLVVIWVIDCISDLWTDQVVEWSIDRVCLPNTDCYSTGTLTDRLIDWIDWFMIERVDWVVDCFIWPKFEAWILLTLRTYFKVLFLQHRAYLRSVFWITLMANGYR